MRQVPGSVAVRRSHTPSKGSFGPTMAQLGVYLAKLRAFEEARKLVTDAAALAPTSGDVLYRRAVVLALAGQRDEGIEALQEAFAHGYSVALAKDDEDLVTLRDSSRYQRLINSARLAEGGER